MLVGYARVSTHEQSLALQQDALVEAGCGRTYTDVVSGVALEREGLAAAPDYARAGDTLVVWRLDRLGRSLRHLIEQVTALEARGVDFLSLTDVFVERDDGLLLCRRPLALGGHVSAHAGEEVQPGLHNAEQGGDGRGEQPNHGADREDEDTRCLGPRRGCSRRRYGDS